MLFGSQTQVAIKLSTLLDMNIHVKSKQTRLSLDNSAFLQCFNTGLGLFPVCVSQVATDKAWTVAMARETA